MHRSLCRSALAAFALGLLACGDLPPTAGPSPRVQTPSLDLSAAAVPAPPGNLVAVSPRPGIVVLTWTDLSNNETRFEILQFGVVVRSIGRNLKTAVIHSLDPGTSYHWDVRACNADGCSAGHGVVGKTPDGSDARAIDFAALACATPEYHPPLASPFATDGYTFTNLSGTNFGSWCSSATHYAGSAALYNGGGNTTARLSRSDGKSFFVSSIDLAQLYYGQTGPVSIVFTGMREDGTTISQTVTFNGNGGTPAFQRATFGPLFDTRIASLSWSQGGNDLHQFDNVRIWQ